MARAPEALVERAAALLDTIADAYGVSPVTKQKATLGVPDRSVDDLAADIEKAKATGRKRIPGDGDGDGIPNEGRKPGGGSNPFASRHKAGAIENFWNGTGKVAYSVLDRSDAKKGANSDRPWRFVGAADRAKIELISSKATPFKDGFQNKNSDSLDFKDMNKGGIRSLISAAYKAGSGKDADDATADAIAAKFTPFKSLRAENSDSKDFASIGRATVQQVAASAFLRGKAARSK